MDVIGRDPQSDVRSAAAQRAAYTEPVKLIETQEDVSTFLEGPAYTRIVKFIRILSEAVVGERTDNELQPSNAAEAVLSMVEKCNVWIDECVPHTGVRRFGNLAFRDFHQKLQLESPPLLVEILSAKDPSSIVELLPYFTGAFGSSQRLDYGTGHELSFIAFLCGLFMVDMLSMDSTTDIRFVGLRIFPVYLGIVQKLITRYTLEPAGSHGVWGLDDHFAVPYILGSSQLSQLEPETFPTPASITNPKDIDEFRNTNLYFNAIGFINDVKKGPFWEHSPMLYDISGVANWQKISAGMRKMYNAEVLGKLPVVQHFPFGRVLFPFSQAPGATAATRTDATYHPMSHQSIAPRNQPGRTLAAVREHDPDLTQMSSGGRVTAATSGNAANASRPMNFANSAAHAGTRISIPAIRSVNNHRSEMVEVANTEGIATGIGVDGVEGTKAPFMQPRTVHPKVLESEKKRADST